MTVTSKFLQNDVDKMYYGTSIERTALSGMAVGSHFFETDTYLEYVFTGSWVRWHFHTVTT